MRAPSDERRAYKWRVRVQWRSVLSQIVQQTGHQRDFRTMVERGAADGQQPQRDEDCARWRACGPAVWGGAERDDGEATTDELFMVGGRNRMIRPILDMHSLQMDTLLTDASRAELRHLYATSSSPSAPT